MTDWPSIRNLFPVTEQVAYLNTAAAGPLSRPVAAAATNYYDLMSADGDIHWDDWLQQREAVRQRVARFINAEPEEIGLTTNTSSGMNVIIDALEQKGEVISCNLEFPVSTIPWMHRRIPVHLVKAKAGAIDLADIRTAMSAKTGVISLSHVQFSNGFRLDLGSLGEIKGKHALVINASQSAGVFEIDVKGMRIDALCATGHKWMLSGYGSGFVYISRELLEASHSRSIGWLSVQDPYAMRNDEIHLRRDAAARVELGCPHFAGIFAMGAAIDLFDSVGIKQIEARALALNQILTNRLIKEGWRVLSPLQNERMRSAETLIEMAEPARVVAHLAQAGVIVTEKPEGIRVATNFFNNEDDIERLVDGLRQGS